MTKVSFVFDLTPYVFLPIASFLLSFFWSAFLFSLLYSCFLSISGRGVDSTERSEDSTGREVDFTGRGVDSMGGAVESVWNLCGGA
jgi:hypothetical protein